MKTYEVKSPRAAFALAAVVLATLTIGIAGVWPAQVEADRASTAVLAGDGHRTAAEIASGAPHVDRIDVVAVREPRLSVHATYLRYLRQG